MRYLALLFGPEGSASEPGTPEFEAELAGYEKFGQLAGDAIVGGEALHPAHTAVTIRPSDGAPLVTAGPYAETAEVVGGFYVLEAGTLDDAIELARNIPAAEQGAVELWPMVMWMAEPGAAGPDRWLALLLAGADEVVLPDTPAWEEGAAEHAAFGAAAGKAVVGGGALHPPTMATTVKVRDHEVLVTDGPFAETAEVANGLYLLHAGSREEATELAARIPLTPRGCVELRPVVDFGG